MWISALLALWNSQIGRTLAVIAAIGLALYVWTEWNRRDAAKAVIEEQEKHDAEVIRKVDRAAYSWRECLVSGGMWDFASAKCLDPE